MIFLASPYSSKSPEIREMRFKAACKAAGILLKAGNNVFSPIAHSHPIAIAAALPLDADYWWNFNATMLQKSNMLYVLQLPCWQESVGVQREIQLANELGIHTKYSGEVNLDLTTFKIFE